MLIKIELEGYQTRGKYRTKRPVLHETVTITTTKEALSKDVEKLLPTIHERIAVGLKETDSIGIDKDTSMVEDFILKPLEEKKK